ncbi:MAG: DUF4159 domain-containing protein [Pirellulales bacterium]
MNRQIVISATLLLALLSDPCGAQDTAKAKASSQIPLAHKRREELKLKHDSFTFVRIKYSGVNGRSSTWATDYPDSDRAFSARLQKEIGLKADPKGIVLALSDPKLKEYPFAYLAEGGSLHLAQAEADALRAYLEGGGFLMVDDFWGEAEWTNLALQIKKAFPQHKFIELPLEHPVFHSFYDIRAKPQVPSIHFALTRRNSGVTWERDDAKVPHYRGLFDGKGRLMAIFCHNTDLGDGWERQGIDEHYTQEFSLKRAFPMGINIVVFALSQ